MARTRLLYTLGLISKVEENSQPTTVHAWERFLLCYSVSTVQVQEKKIEIRESPLLGLRTVPVNDVNEV